MNARIKKEGKTKIEKQNKNVFNQTLMEKDPASQALLETTQKLELLRTD